MKKTLFAFLSAILVIITTLIIALVESGVLILPLWLFRDIVLPIIHFGIAASIINKKEHKCISTVIWSTSVFVLTIVGHSIVIDIVMYSSRIAGLYIAFRLAWVILMGALVLGLPLASNASKSSSKKLVIICGAALALVLNAFLTYLAARPIASAFAIDGIEVILMLITAVVLSVMSYRLGAITEKKLFLLKAAVWLIFVVASEFATMTFLGSPINPPIKDLTALIIWLVVSVIMFMFYLIGYWRKDARPILKEKATATP